MGRVVFGGGGITPDVFIPLDTSFNTDYFLSALQFLPQFASRWMEKQNKATLPDKPEAFSQQFRVPDPLLMEFVKFVESQGVAVNAGELERSKPELSRLLKARIAKLLFQEEGQYRVLNDDDPAVEKALHVLRSGVPVAKK